MSSPARPPRDNLIRALSPGVEIRAAGESDQANGYIGTMHGHFAVFDQWTQIDSAWEGTFLERIAPGAFAKTIRENRDQVKPTLNHGMDPFAGDKPLGPVRVLEEDEVGVAYEVPLLDTSYNRDILPGLQAGLYGASFRFQVVKEELVDEPKASDYNPRALPERTIKEVRLYEFGPVTFPAYQSATAGVRSLTDFFVLDRLVAQPERLRELVDALPALSDDGAEAAPHSDEESRAAAEPTPPAAADQPPQHERQSEMDISQFKTRDQMADRVAEITASVNALVEEFPTTMPPEREAEFNALVEERNALEPELERANRRAAFVRGQADRPENVEVPIPNISVKREIIWDPADVFSRGGSQEQRGQLFRDNALRIAERATYPRQDVGKDKSLENIQRLLDEIDAPTRSNPDHELARRIQATGSPAYGRAFDKYVRTGGTTGWSPEEQRAAALAVQVDTTGGFALPFAFDPTFIPTGAYTAINPFRTPGLCRIEQIAGTDTWQGVSVGAVSATRADEAAAATEQGPTFAQPSALVTRVHVAVTYSVEAGQDIPNLPSQLAALIAEAKATEEEAMFSAGDATAVGSKTEPIGIAPAGGGAVAGQFGHVHMAAAHTYAKGDLALVEDALALRYRANAVWGMAKKTIRSTQALETVYGELFDGQYYPGVGGVAIANPGGNTGKRLMTYPLFEFPSIGTDVSVDDTAIAVLFDPSRYLIVDRIGMNVELIPHMFADAAGSLPTGQRALYAYWRNTAKPVNTGAGVVLYVLNA